MGKMLDKNVNVYYNNVDVITEFNEMKHLEGSVIETEEVCLKIAIKHGFANYEELLDFIYTNRIYL